LPRIVEKQMRYVKTDLIYRSCHKNDLKLTSTTHRNNVNIDMLNTNNKQTK